MRTPFRTTMLLATLAGALALPLALGSVARSAAGDDARVVALPVPGVASGEYRQTVARCPAGEHAISGGIGFVSSGGTGAVGIAETWPYGTLGLAADGWVTEIRNTSGAPQNFTAYAVCSRSSDAVIRPTPFSTAFDGGSLAPCLPGERAIGGGVSAQDSPFPGVVQLGGPVDETGETVSTDDGDIPRAWYVSVRHHTGAGLNFQAYAICSATSQATIQATALTVANGESGQATAVCPAGQRALSGGLGTTGGRLGAMGFSGPTDADGAPATEGSSAQSWTADVYNTNGASETYKVLVVCEGPAPAPPPPPVPGPAPAPGPAPVPGPAPTCDGLPATIVGTGASERIDGTAGADVIAALGGNDTVNAGAGDDVVCGGAGADNLKGQGGTDRLFGQAARDRLAGGAGANDFCHGGAGADRARASCERTRRL